MRTALVNTNRIHPPIAPIGLEYVAETCRARGFTPDILDLCWEEDWEESIRAFFGEREYDVVGIGLRNTDDCAFSSGQSFLGLYARVVSIIKSCTGGLLVGGGVGFSVMNDTVMNGCPLDAGVLGDGEAVFPGILDSIDKKEEWENMPNVVFKRNGRVHRTPPDQRPVDLPPLRRDMIDNVRYFREGGQAGFESKRGCSGRCIYCCEPSAKGRKVRARPPAEVADEIARLRARGIDHFHTCDSEFNIPEEHAIGVCEEIIARGLGERIRWYAYCTPAPFSSELAGAMRRAGCAGINFGIDSGDPGMLKSLKRGFEPEDIERAARCCERENITVMFDLLIGAPGESEESMRNTVELAKRSCAARIGVSTGVRVYEGTELALLVRDPRLEAGLIKKKAVDASGSPSPGVPFRGVPFRGIPELLYFIEPALGMDVFGILDRLIGGDGRFLFFDPSNPSRNYNYNANELLQNAISDGYRGAYWDILRRLQDKDDPA